MRHSLSLFLACLLLAACSSQTASTLHLCVGTYGDHFYRVTFCDGRFGPAHAVAAPDASFVLPLDGGFLFAVSENDPHSGICSFRGDSLTAFNPEIGGSPCYLMQVEGRPFVLTADYNGGSVSVFETDGGVVGRRVQCIRYHGSGPVKGNQEQAHVHQLKTIPASIRTATGIRGEWLMATDLGCDSIHILRVHDTAEASSLLSDCPGLAVPLPPGSGPRHMEWNEAQQLLYCITELSGEVLVWKVGADDGAPTFTLRQRVEADDAHAAGSADIHLHPSGRFLYTSHRLKDDGITRFLVGDDGLLTRVDKVHTEGHPRHFFITPDGRYLLAACRDGHCVQVFDIHEQSGALTPTDEQLTTDPDSPVCVALER